MATTIKILSLMFVLSASAFAADADVIAPSNTDAVAGIIISIAQKYPVLLSVFALMGVLRGVFKPIMVFAHKFAASTATPKDDEFVNKIESSTAWKAMVFVIDYVASIKLPK